MLSRRAIQRVKTAGLEFHLPPNLGRKLAIVGCDYQSRAILRVQAEQQVLHLFAYAVIEGAGGLVSQNQFRLQDHGAGDRNPLLLPAEEFARAMCHAIFEPDFREQRATPPIWRAPCPSR